MRRPGSFVVVLGVFAASCVHTTTTVAPPRPLVVPPLEATPVGPLPPDVRPSHYALELHIDPKADRFAGVVDIDVELDHPRQTLWLHGKELHVTRVELHAAGAVIPATWRDAHASGVGAVELANAVPAGRARLHVEWDAAFDRHLRGLYRVDRGTDAYAFTQFEAIAARRAFPSFDEPRFKTPFDVTLEVPEGAVAIANTRELRREGRRVTFARTEPLPTYLLAWAVGPLDVVDGAPVPPNAVRKTPLPFRAIAARGRGKELAYTLAHTGEILATLENWFGIPYPYDKLDVLAVPDRDGAMENAGAITFQEALLLLDEKSAPLQQKRAFAGVMAHELAHHWFGDLVTMPWWDDIWLNEAFATWMGTRTVQTWRPETNADVYLLDRIGDAMSVDALVSARAIRQPIGSEHDITNAFDSITYQKGAAVLSMFERWLGRDQFQQGVRAYLRTHANATAVADDLLAALDQAAPPERKGVGAAFRTFLDRPGLPFVDARLDCSGKPTLRLAQSRYFPVGSTGAPKEGATTWQIPVCARTPSGESCTLLKDATGAIALDACPAWVMPNADAAGYYRFGLPRAELTALLQKGLPTLSTRERLALAESIRASFAQATAKASDVLDDLSLLARDPFPSVASAPMGIVQASREWLDGSSRTHVEAFARGLYAKSWSDLGLSPQKGESPERTITRQSLLSFLAFTGRDPALRKAAATLGRAYLGFGKDQKLHPEAVDRNLAGLCLMIAAEDGDAALFDALLRHLDENDDPIVRARVLSALGSFETPALAARAQALTLDPRLRMSEVLLPLSVQLGKLETREAAWTWLREHFDAVVSRISAGRSGGLPWYVRFCDEAHVAEVEAFFTPRIAALDGGPRNLASALEHMRLCVARRKAHEADLRLRFAK